MLPWKLRKRHILPVNQIFHQYISFINIFSFSLWAATFLLQWFGKWHLLTNCQSSVQPPGNARPHDNPEEDWGTTRCLPADNGLFMRNREQIFCRIQYSAYAQFNTCLPQKKWQSQNTQFIWIQSKHTERMIKQLLSNSCVSHNVLICQSCPSVKITSAFCIAK